jgi:hypothetical protein
VVELLRDSVGSASRPVSPSDSPLSLPIPAVLRHAGAVEHEVAAGSVLQLNAWSLAGLLSQDERAAALRFLSSAPAAVIASDALWVGHDGGGRRPHGLVRGDELSRPFHETLLERYDIETLIVAVRDSSDRLDNLQRSHGFHGGIVPDSVAEHRELLGLLG